MTWLTQTACRGEAFPTESIEMRSVAPDASSSVTDVRVGMLRPYRSPLPLRFRIGGFAFHCQACYTFWLDHSIPQQACSVGLRDLDL